MYTKATTEDLHTLREAATITSLNTLNLPDTFAAQLCHMFTAWRRLGELDLDFLNRQGGSETRALARTMRDLHNRSLCRCGHMRKDHRDDGTDCGPCPDDAARTWRHSFNLLEVPK
jgi:hypothetical protein